MRSRDNDTGDIDLGAVSILVGFAPLKPAEFVIVSIQEDVMAEFSVSAQHFDHRKNFMFRVKWDGRYVASVSRVGAMKPSTEVVEHRSGGDPSLSRKSPGRTKDEPVTLERGVTHDAEFERWANRSMWSDLALSAAQREVLAPE